jgi:hypothetical protein
MNQHELNAFVKAVKATGAVIINSSYRTAEHQKRIEQENTTVNSHHNKQLTHEEILQSLRGKRRGRKNS